MGKLGKLANYHFYETLCHLTQEKVTLKDTR